MPVRIVDLLEPVEVEEQQRHMPIPSCCQSHGLVVPVQQEATIREAGQLVVIREPARL